MSASLQRRRDAHTVLLRMARDEARAERIRGLKARYDKVVTWAEIAAAVGVAERSALAWQQTGEISRPNAVKLAKFFQEKGELIDEDYVWSGPRPSTPDLMRTLNGAEDSELVEEIKLLVERVGTLEQVIARLAESLEARLPQAAPRRRRASGS